jgi:hypothetical protein
MRVCLTTCFLCLWICLMSSADDDLQVGAAKVKITPPLGVPMAGYYHGRGADGVHDDLFARTIVIQQGSERAALVALDLIRIDVELVEQARQRVQATTKIPGAHVMVSATHTHTGPEINARSARHADMDSANDLSHQYAEGLPALIAESVRLAEAALQPARALVALGREDSLAFNRRFHMRDGTVGWNPGKKNPLIIKPAGPIDPAVTLVYFETLEKKPLGCYVNYAVHLDNVGGTLISADMPYTLSRCLSEVKGPDFVTVYTTACCGDINHINVNWDDPQHGHDNAARMGIILAGAVLRLLPELQPVTGPLCVRQEMVALPLPAITPEDVQLAKEVAARTGAHDTTRTAFMEAVHAFKVLDVANREGRPIEVEVQVVTLGQTVAWVSLPGEVFVELGLDLKQDSPFPYTMIAELGNGCIGYIPCRRAYPQGNYEVVSARCGEGSGELLVQAAVRMLTQIRMAHDGASAPQ